MCLHTLNSGFSRFIATQQPWILSIWLCKSLLHTTFLPQTVQCYFGFYLNHSFVMKLFDMCTHVRLGFFPIAFHEPGKLVLQRIHGRFLCIFNFNFFRMLKWTLNLFNITPEIDFLYKSLYHTYYNVDLESFETILL